MKPGPWEESYTAPGHFGVWGGTSGNELGSVTEQGLGGLPGRGAEMPGPWGLRVY